MATIRWCPIYPKWDTYQPLWYFHVFSGNWSPGSFCFLKSHWTFSKISCWDSQRFGRLKNPIPSPRTSATHPLTPHVTHMSLPENLEGHPPKFDEFHHFHPLRYLKITLMYQSFFRRHRASKANPSFRRMFTLLQHFFFEVLTTRWSWKSPLMRKKIVPCLMKYHHYVTDFCWSLLLVVHIYIYICIQYMIYIYIYMSAHSDWSTFRIPMSPAKDRISSPSPNLEPLKG